MDIKAILRVLPSLNVAERQQIRDWLDESELAVARAIGVAGGFRQVLAKAATRERSLACLLESFKERGTPLDTLEKWVLEGPESEEEKDFYLAVLSRVWKGNES